ncbi:hypothetical protein D5085_07535 [Ectothiorhodospiraceae bacterium BW-2]|nr:hypothetical protein D5085_07535 [Ectothiorhodospiraceae bacterium BW-2]
MAQGIGPCVRSWKNSAGGNYYRGYHRDHNQGLVAEADQAMGFCFFNNLAIGVAHALSHPDINKVAIIDFDVHHGNGTDAIFANQPRVSLFSSYQHPFYPGTVAVTPYTILLPAGSQDTHAWKLMQQQWLPTLKSLQPDMLFFSAGFDAHQDDWIGGLNWSTESKKQFLIFYLFVIRIFHRR